jgi:hypothetical protein
MICAAPNLFYLNVVHISERRRSCLLRYSDRSHAEHQRRYIIHKSMETIIFYFVPLVLQIGSYTKIAQQLCSIDESLQVSFALVKRDRPVRRARHTTPSPFTCLSFRLASTSPANRTSTSTSTTSTVTVPSPTRSFTCPTDGRRVAARAVRCSPAAGAGRRAFPDLLNVPRWTNDDEARRLSSCGHKSLSMH